MTARQTTLIAETDGDGEVVAVWIAGPDGRKPRPLRDRREALSHLAGAVVSGAPSSKIADWARAKRDVASR